MKKTEKGSYGYINGQKKWSIIRTVFYFALSLAIFLMGYFSAKTKVNLLTVVAMLGMLPASKSLVNMIMFFRSRGCQPEAYEQIVPNTEGLIVLYDLVMTTYDKNFMIESLAVKGHIICGYSGVEKTDVDGAQKHIEETISMAGYKGYNVKIFKELDKYVTRLSQMRELEVEEIKHQEAVLENLLSVSL